MNRTTKTLAGLGVVALLVSAMPADARFGGLRIQAVSGEHNKMLPQRPISTPS